MLSVELCTSFFHTLLYTNVPLLCGLVHSVQVCFDARFNALSIDCLSLCHNLLPSMHSVHVV